MRKILCFIIILCTIGFSAFAESFAKIDSLEDVLDKLDESHRIEVLNQLATEYLTISLEKSKSYSNNALRLALKYNDIAGQAAAYKIMGKTYYFQKKIDNALDYYKKALPLFEQTENIFESAAILYNIGYIHKGRGNYQKAIEYFERSLLLYEQLEDSEEIASTQRTIGITYFYWSNYDMAIQYYEKSLEIRKKLNDQMGVANTFQTIGIVYHEWDKYDKALNFYQNSLKTFEQLSEKSPDDIEIKRSIANANMNIGQVYKDWGRYKDSKDIKEKSLDYLNKSLNIMQEIDDQIGIAYALSNIGVIYEDIGSYDNAIVYFKKSLLIEEKEGDKDGAAGTLLNLGVIYTRLSDFEKALDYLFQSNITYNQLDNDQGIADCKLRIGDVYKKKKEYQKALEAYYASLETSERLNSRKTMEENYKSISDVKRNTGDYKGSFEYYLKYTEMKDSIFNVKSSKQLTEMKEKYESEEKEKQIELLNKERQMKDLRLESQRRLMYFIIIGLIAVVIFSILVFRQVRLKKKANIKLALQNEEISQQKEEIQAINEQLGETNRELEKLSIVASKTDNSVIIMEADGTFEWVNEGFTRLFGYSLVEYRHIAGDNLFETSTNPKIRETVDECIKQKTSAVYISHCVTKDGVYIWLQTTLTPIISTTGELIKLVAIDSDVTKIKDAEEKIKLQKQAMTDSIHYARRIQNALLPPGEILEGYVSDYFVVNRPRDIVSGDFYWMSHVDKRIVFAVADCTGHGVPGAFMSILGVAFLNEIVNTSKKIQAAIILDKLREYVMRSLHQTGKTGEQKDGMDIALCILDPETLKLDYAGAYNPLYITHPDPDSLNGEAVLTELKADKMPIGIYFSNENRPFTSKEIELVEDSCLYLFSDGFIDQFGGKDEKKFKSVPFKRLLTESYKLSMTEQKDRIIKTFEEWKGDLEQIDDILIMGMKCNRKKV